MSRPTERTSSIPVFSMRLQERFFTELRLSPTARRALTDSRFPMPLIFQAGRMKRFPFLLTRINITICSWSTLRTPRQRQTLSSRLPTIWAIHTEVFYEGFCYRLRQHCAGSFGDTEFHGGNRDFVGCRYCWGKSRQGCRKIRLQGILWLYKNAWWGSPWRRAYLHSALSSCWNVGRGSFKGYPRPLREAVRHEQGGACENPHGSAHEHAWIRRLLPEPLQFVCKSNKKYSWNREIRRN